MLKAIYLAAAIGLAALPAHAATMKAVITGKVGSGTDPSGLFVDPGAALSYA